MLYQNAVVGSSATLRGHLYDESLCRPLDAGLVYVYNLDGEFIDAAVVGDNQRYQVDVEPASYLLAAESEGYARSINENVDVSGDGITQYNIKLAPEAAITGNILLSAPVPPEPRLTIVAEENDQPIAAQAYHGEVTGDEFAIHGLPAGMYDIMFTAEGYLPETVANIVVAEEAAVDIGTVTLHLAASVSGTITNSVPGLTSDEYMVGVFVGGELVAGATVDVDGLFSFAGLEPGTYDFQLLDSEGIAHSPSFQLTLGYGDTFTDVDLYAWPGGTISGAVADSVPAPISGLGVVLFDADGNETYAVTDETGTYEFTSLGLGTYTVALATAGAATAQTVEVTDLNAAIFTADFTVSSTASIEGVVSYSDGSPVEGAVVSIFENDHFIGTAVSNDLGRYFFKVLREGTFELRGLSDVGSFSSASVTVTAGGSYTRDFVAGTGSVQVSVDAGASDLAGTSVLISNELGIVLYATLENDGIEVFNNLVPGDYTVEAFGPDNKQDEEQVTVNAGQSVQLNLELLAKARVSGNLYVDSQGGAIAPNVIIYFRSQADPDKAYPGISDATGTYAVEYLELGTYDAVIFGEGYELTIHTDITITDDAVMDLVVSSASVHLTGRLVDTSGYPVPLAHVSVYDANGQLCGDSRVNSDGSFNVEAFAADDLSLVFSANGYLTREISSISAQQGVNDKGDIVIEPVVHGSDYGESSVTIGSTVQLTSWTDLFVNNFTQELVEILYELTSSPEKNPLHVDDYSVLISTCAYNLCSAYYHALWPAVNEQDRKWADVVEDARVIYTLRGVYHSEVVGYLAKITNQVLGLLNGKTALQSLARQAPARILLLKRIEQAISFVKNWVIGAQNAEKKAKDAVTPGDAVAQAKAGIDFFNDIKSKASSLFQDNKKFVEDMQRVRRGVAQAQGTSFGTSLKFLDKLALIETITVDLAELFNKLHDIDEQIVNMMESYEREYASYNLKVGIAHYKFTRYKWCLDSQEAQECSDDDDDGNGDPDPGPDPGPDGGTGGSSPNPPNPPPNPDPDSNPYNPEYVVSADPNDIIGPAGYGEERWVSVNDTLPYIIRFENMADASAPAQRVVITQQLDEDLDFRTFRVTDFGWGEQYTEVGADLPFYLGRIELIDGSGLVVDVLATVDVVSGIATWVLETIDPATGEPPEDALAGFLPPNDENGIGEGFVSYTIRPRSGIATWSVIDAEATIVFDTNEPIDTPPVFNTVDAVAPTSSISEANLEVETVNIFVSWSGEDDPGSALRDYNVYVSTDGEPYTIWLEHTTLTSAWFVGQQNHDYDFYSTARDNAGNVEAFPTAPDAGANILLYDFETGDLNHDGEVSLTDAILALKVISSVPVAGSIYFDTEVNGDGRIGAADLLYILQTIVGLR